MKRQTWFVLAVSGTLAAILLAPAVGQEPTRSRSLAERFGSLRFGWRADEEQPAPSQSSLSQPRSSRPDQRSAGQPVQQPAGVARARTGSRQTVPPRIASLPSSRGQRLPRVNPRDLLPRDFVGPEAVADRSSSKAPAVTVPSGAAGERLQTDSVVDSRGSLRSRILRELQSQPPAVAADRTTDRARSQATPRAGSVLSPSAERVLPPSVAGQLRERIKTQPRSSDFLRQATEASVAAAKQSAEEERATVSKMIAAEVAEQMASQDAVAATPIAAAPPEVETPAPGVSDSQPATAAVAPPWVPVPSAAVSVPQAEPQESFADASPQRAEPQDEQPSAVDRVAAPVAVVASTPRRISLGRGSPTPAPSIKPSGALRVEETFESPRSVATNAGRDDVLITQSTPQITTKVLGPRRVMIGQPARFQVQLNNRGNAAAEELAARVLAPAWAEVIKMNVTDGVVERSPRAEQAIAWRVDRFAAGAGATMDLTLVAREGRPIELGVDWTHAPVSSSALVEVQEPKLRMQISGSDEVYYGKPQLFRLTLSNPGTGVAEGVSLLLAPPGKTIDEATRHAIGDLDPGASKSVEIELTAREAGRLALVARADAAAGVTTSVEKQVFCRKAEIEIDWRGPEQKYTGAPATYYFRVRNAGTAPAEAVTLDLTLPEGFEMTSASQDPSYDSRRRLLRWRIGSLRAGDDHYMELKGVARTAGEKRMDVYAETGDKLVSDRLSATTSVIAVADLKLDVLDPKGPLPVGADAVYEVRVRNRGSNVAEKIEVVALFSGGIEPLSVEGRPCRIADGRVAAPVIDRLPAGGEVVLRIHAKAVEPGTHVFRAEVACPDLEIRLAAEEMTRFYPDDTLLDSDAPRAAGAAERFTQPR